MVLKLGSEFGIDFNRYKNLEDGAPKSEMGFLKFLDRDASQAMTKADRNKRFRLSRNDKSFINKAWRVYFNADCRTFGCWSIMASTSGSVAV
jgi:hypothetical protein